MSAGDPGDEPTPDLRKREPGEGDGGPSTGPQRSGGSIWERLDGSTPPAPAPPFTAPHGSPWHRQGDGPPPRHQVAAAYAAAGRSAPGRPAQGAFTLAGWPRRLGAFLIDGLIFATIALALTLPLGQLAGLGIEETSRFFATFGREPANVTDTLPLYAAMALQRLILGILSAFFLTRWNGQTPGKRLLGLRVMRADGERLGAATAIRREVLGRVLIIDTLTLVTLGIAWALNYLFPLWDPQRRAGHDLVAGTRVVAEQQPRR